MKKNKEKGGRKNVSFLLFPYVFFIFLFFYLFFFQFKIFFKILKNTLIQGRKDTESTLFKSMQTFLS